MKSPTHPVPSGDRLMGRLLFAVLQEIAGEANVSLASEFRSYSGMPDNLKLKENRSEAHKVADATFGRWQQRGWLPDVWFSYHPYYKSPDWLGPIAKARFGCPIVTAEASFSSKRAEDEWSEWHHEHAHGLAQADCHLYMKDRDRAGLLALPAHEEQLVHLPPFIDIRPFTAVSAGDRTRTAPIRLITVAMMRKDVKLKSYQFLAEALLGLQDLDWTLDIVGDGAAHRDVQAAFTNELSSRIHWHGQVAPEKIPVVLANADVFVWPGFGEAYGLAYLEAQACGLPVVAQNCAGVPEVVIQGQTGLLTREGELGAYQSALRRIISDQQLVTQMGQAARTFVHTERSIKTAEQTIRTTIDRAIGRV